METTFDRFYPTHPGEVLKDELEERGISQRKFGKVSVWDIPYSTKY